MFATRTPTPSRTGALRATVLAGALLASTVGVAACGSSHSSTPSSSPSSAGTAEPSATIVIKNFAFQPSTLDVAPGAKVTVENEDSATHTVTASGSAKPFDTGNIAPGTTTTFTAPTQPGSYPYICQIHQFMHGTLVVR